MQSSFLEYAYSVIYSRALPDARDGLKPVQRRILYTMDEMGLRPDRGHVKSARVVGEVMGELHPHGDGAIYDALVRMAQPWSMRLPIIDGHGNFGSPDDSPAAMRYTECRMAPAAVAMTASIDEDTVDFKPNYDSRETEPVVLPSAIPNLLVNGTTGIAVGMATNIAPHNLVEVVQALRHLITHPKATLDDLMRFIPGPDLPTGGKIVGLDGIRDAYETGRGTFRMRATARVESVTAATQGHRRHRAPLRRGHRAGDRADQGARPGQEAPGHRRHQGPHRPPARPAPGHRGQERLRPRGAARAALQARRRWRTPSASTPSRWSTASRARWASSELLEVFLEHRFDVVRRRSLFRRAKAADRLHLVDGLLIAILDIDEVIQVIRSSDNAAAAKERLIDIFELSEIQADYILDMPLRRLTKFSKLELDKEKAELERTIERARRDPRRREAAAEGRLRRARRGRQDLRHPAAHRPARLGRHHRHGRGGHPLEVADDPCFAYLSSSGLLARTSRVEHARPGRGPGQPRRRRRAPCAPPPAARSAS